MKPGNTKPGRSRPPSRWWSVALLAGVACFGVLTAEAALALFHPQPRTGTWTVLDDENNLINRSGGRVRHELVDGRVAYYNFNSAHQRGTEDPSPAADRVLVLGDSFTFGWGLPEEQTYVSLLQKHLDGMPHARRIQLLNAAVGGWGTADEVAYLRKYGGDIAPRGVIVFVSFDDFRRALKSRSFRIDPATGDVVRVPVERTGSSAKKLLQDSAFYNWLLEHSHLVQLIRQAIVFKGGIGVVTTPGTQPADADADVAAQKEVARALFRWIKRWSDEHHASLIVLTTGWYSIDYPWLTGEMKDLGIDFVDLCESVRPVMLRDGPETYFIRYDGHPNARGAQLIADAAWQALAPWFKTLDKAR